jgi:Kef-type K+ transport system membrane component KefB
VLKDPAGTLFVILAIAFLAPLCARVFHRLRIPGLVFEIGLGIIVGPQVLNLVAMSDPIRLFATLGLATLIFLAGLEIDPVRIKGRPIQLAGLGWLISIGLGFAMAFALTALGIVQTEMFVAFALTTTALGTLLPILQDTGLLGTTFGTQILAIGSVGEFGPILAVALVLSGASPVRSSVALVVFSAGAIVAFIAAARMRSARFRNLLGSTLRSSGQLYVRLAVLLLAALTLFAAKLDLDFLLGAFVAGIVFRLFLNATANETERDAVEAKIEAVSYGYLVPIFFVVTGITFDLNSLISSPVALLKLPLFLLLFLIARGVPVVLYRRVLPSRRERFGLAFLSATALPLVVAICTIGVERDLMRASTAAALIGAGMLSVVIGPLLGLRCVSNLLPTGPDAESSQAKGIGEAGGPSTLPA